MADTAASDPGSALPFAPPHPALPAEYDWDADGALALLETPLLPGYVSRRAADADFNRYIRMAVRLCSEGWTLIGGFVGARERDLLDAVARAVPRYRLIRLEPGPLGEGRLTASQSAAYAAGRLLRLTTAEPDGCCTRALCVRHNRLADRLAGAWPARVEAHFAAQPAADPVRLANLRAWLAVWPRA